MERIQGLENMSCEEIEATLSGIMAKAEEDAKALRVEIEQAYTERGQVNKQLKDAAAKKDLDAYKEARIRFNFLTDFIAGAEKRVDDLENASLLDNEDFLAIKRKMESECFEATVNAVEQIVRELEHIDEIQDSLNPYISSRNSVLIALVRCARAKNKNGNDDFSIIYKEDIVRPYARNLKILRDGPGSTINDIARANFNIFFRDYVSSRFSSGA